MNTISKTFDSVAFQRKAREEIDILMMGLSYKEKKRTTGSVMKLRERINKLKELSRG